MSPVLRLSKVSASYGVFRHYALAARNEGRFQAARFWAQHARADFRQLCHLTGQPIPAAHRTADSFTA